MKKRLSRMMRKILVQAAGVVLLLLVVWALSHMGGVLNWLAKNWFPCLVGFLFGVIGNAVVDDIFKNEEPEK